VILNCGAWGVRPDLPYHRIDRNYKFLTDTLNGSREEVQWAASDPRAVGSYPCLTSCTK